jgi:hypothetical protein
MQRPAGDMWATVLARELEQLNMAIELTVSLRVQDKLKQPVRRDLQNPVLGIHTGDPPNLRGHRFCKDLQLRRHSAHGFLKQWKVRVILSPGLIR